MTNDTEFYRAHRNVSDLLNVIFKKLSIPSPFVVGIFTYLWEHRDLTIELDNEAKKIWQKN